MTNQEIGSALQKQLELTEKVMEKLEIQKRFLYTLHMKGLNRILQEQAVFIEEFAAIGRRLNEHNEWKSQREFYTLKEKVDRQYKTMLVVCQQLLDAAVGKRQGIAAEIAKSKQQRTMKHAYVRQWQFTAATVKPKFNVTG